MVFRWETMAGDGRRKTRVPGGNGFLTVQWRDTCRDGRMLDFKPGKAVSMFKCVNACPTTSLRWGWFLVFVSLVFSQTAVLVASSAPKEGDTVSSPEGSGSEVNRLPIGSSDPAREDRPVSGLTGPGIADAVTSAATARVDAPRSESRPSDPFAQVSSQWRNWGSEDDQRSGEPLKENVFRPSVLRPSPSPSQQDDDAVGAKVSSEGLPEEDRSEHGLLEEARIPSLTRILQEDEDLRKDTPFYPNENHFGLRPRNPLSFVVPIREGRQSAPPGDSSRYGWDGSIREASDGGEEEGEEEGHMSNNMDEVPEAPARPGSTIFSETPTWIAPSLKTENTTFPSHEFRSTADEKELSASRLPGQQEDADPEFSRGRETGRQGDSGSLKEIDFAHSDGELQQWSASLTNSTLIARKRAASGESNGSLGTAGVPDGSSPLGDHPPTGPTPSLPGMRTSTAAESGRFVKRASVSVDDSLQRLRDFRHKFRSEGGGLAGLSPFSRFRRPYPPSPVGLESSVDSRDTSGSPPDTREGSSTEKKTTSPQMKNEVSRFVYPDPVDRSWGTNSHIWSTGGDNPTGGDAAAGASERVGEGRRYADGGDTWRDTSSQYDRSPSNRYEDASDSKGGNTYKSRKGPSNFTWYPPRSAYRDRSANSPEYRKTSENGSYGGKQLRRGSDVLRKQTPSLYHGKESSLSSSSSGLPKFLTASTFYPPADWDHPRVSKSALINSLGLENPLSSSRRRRHQKGDNSTKGLARTGGHGVPTPSSRRSSNLHHDDRWKSEGEKVAFERSSWNSVPAHMLQLATTPGSTYVDGGLRVSVPGDHESRYMRARDNKADFHRGDRDASSAGGGPQSDHGVSGGGEVPHRLLKNLSLERFLRVTRGGLERLFSPVVRARLCRELLHQPGYVEMFTILVLLHVRWPAYTGQPGGTRVFIEDLKSKTVPTKVLGETSLRMLKQCPIHRMCRQGLASLSERLNTPQDMEALRNLHFEQSPDFFRYSMNYIGSGTHIVHTARSLFEALAVVWEIFSTAILREHLFGMNTLELYRLQRSDPLFWPTLAERLLDVWQRERSTSISVLWTYMNLASLVDTGPTTRVQNGVIILLLEGVWERTFPSTTLFSEHTTHNSQPSTVTYPIISTDPMRSSPFSAVKLRKHGRRLHSVDSEEEKEDDVEFDERDDHVDDRPSSSSFFGEAFTFPSFPSFPKREEKGGLSETLLGDSDRSEPNTSLRASSLVSQAAASFFQNAASPSASFSLSPPPAPSSISSSSDFPLSPLPVSYAEENRKSPPSDMYKNVDDRSMSYATLRRLQDRVERAIHRRLELVVSRLGLPLDASSMLSRNDVNNGWGWPCIKHIPGGPKKGGPMPPKSFRCVSPLTCDDSASNDESPDPTRLGLELLFSATMLGTCPRGWQGTHRSLSHFRIPDVQVTGFFVEGGIRGPLSASPRPPGRSQNRGRRRLDAFDDAAADDRGGEVGIGHMNSYTRFGVGSSSMSSTEGRVREGGGTVPGTTTSGMTESSSKRPHPHNGEEEGEEEDDHEQEEKVQVAGIFGNEVTQAVLEQLKRDVPPGGILVQVSLVDVGAWDQRKKEQGSNEGEGGEQRFHHNTGILSLPTECGRGSGCRPTYERLKEERDRRSDCREGRSSHCHPHPKRISRNGSSERESYTSSSVHTNSTTSSPMPLTYVPVTLAMRMLQLDLKSDPALEKVRGRASPLIMDTVDLDSAEMFDRDKNPRQDHDVHIYISMPLAEFLEKGGKQGMKDELFATISRHPKRWIAAASRTISYDRLRIQGVGKWTEEEEGVFFGKNDQETIDLLDSFGSGHGEDDDETEVVTTGEGVSLRRRRRLSSQDLPNEESSSSSPGGPPSSSVSSDQPPTPPPFKLGEILHSSTKPLPPPTSSLHKRRMDRSSTPAPPNPSSPNVTASTSSGPTTTTTRSLLFPTFKKNFDFWPPVSRPHDSRGRGKKAKVDGVVLVKSKAFGTVFPRKDEELASHIIKRRRRNEDQVYGNDTVLGLGVRYGHILVHIAIEGLACKLADRNKSGLEEDVLLAMTAHEAMLRLTRRLRSQDDIRVIHVHDDEIDFEFATKTSFDATEHLEADDDFPIWLVAVVNVCIAILFIFIIIGLTCARRRKKAPYWLLCICGATPPWRNSRTSTDVVGRRKEPPQEKPENPRPQVGRWPGEGDQSDHESEVSTYTPGLTQAQDGEIPSEGIETALGAFGPMYDLHDPTSKNMPPSIMMTTLTNRRKGDSQGDEGAEENEGHNETSPHPGGETACLPGVSPVSCEGGGNGRRCSSSHQAPPSSVCGGAGPSALLLRNNEAGNSVSRLESVRIHTRSPCTASPSVTWARPMKRSMTLPSLVYRERDGRRRRGQQVDDDDEDEEDDGESSSLPHSSGSSGSQSDGSSESRAAVGSDASHRSGQKAGGGVVGGLMRLGLRRSFSQPFRTLSIASSTDSSSVPDSAAAFNAALNRRKRAGSFLSGGGNRWRSVNGGALLSSSRSFRDRRDDDSDESSTGSFCL
ncbi:transmembrane protein [Cystoisospora suis]|uniref:Transmembrane protein n=1 Tax=Cystoisospora suis TaxID=483139 RepID=A0A2C6KN77_9APIC|nr:transmembrane protein [Cystoisospora suis]